MTKQSKDIFKELRDQGFSVHQIMYAMEDGTFLKEEGIDEDTSIEIHEHCKDIIKEGNCE